MTVLLLAAGACSRSSIRRAAPSASPPSLVLWVWDRADDLRFLKPGEAEVAALMATIYLRDGAAEAWNRRLPLLLPEGLQPTPVVRLESDGSALPPVEKVVELLAHGASWQTLQLDFDARLSQREWYRKLLYALHRQKRRISMTALASWCVQPPWFASVPDEAVPMLFRMGPQRNRILATLHKQGGFAGGCQDALGISTDERLPWLPTTPKVYVFNSHRWTREAFNDVRARLR